MPPAAKPGRNWRHKKRRWGKKNVQ
jgi:hypothetical protein